MRKQHTWMWPAIAAAGVVMVALIVGLIIFTARSNKPSDDASYMGQPNNSAPSTGQGTPSYSSQNCQPNSGCTAPQNQSQGQGVPPTQGTITAVSDTSITVHPSDGGANKTFRVTSAAKVMKSSASTAYRAADLHVGQAVTVVPTLRDSTTVEYIALDDTGRLNNVNE